MSPPPRRRDAPAADEAVSEGAQGDAQAARDEAATTRDAPLPPRRPKRADGLLPGMIPYRAPGKQIAVTPQCNSPKLAYFGGPIVQSPVIVAVFWNSAVNSQLTAPTTGVGQFYADVTQSAYWSWLQEYNTVGLTGGTEQAILPGSYGGAFTLTPSKCPASTTGGCTLSDAQVQAELTAQINSKVLPAPVLDCTNNSNTIYMIHFPPNITVDGPGGAGKSCVAFCAYHNTGTFGTAKTPLIYGVLMDNFTGPCKTGCAADATAMEATTDNASHELVEAVTDPDIGLDTQGGYAKPAGWGDNSNQCGEIADICAANVAGDTITVSGRTWTVQELWSNKQGKCTSTGPDLPVCSGTTLTNCRKCSCGDNGNACSGATSVCETTSTNVLFGACEQSTSTNDTCPSRGACQQSTTPAQDDICPSCKPATTCPTGQNCGTASDGCGGMIACGTCTTPETCGGGGVANQCGSSCVPATTCPAGQNCGTASDGCGGMIACGTCTAPATCGGGGVANQCGSSCMPLRFCPTGQDCGTAPDGCGGTLDCGACTAPETCGGAGVANQCGGGCVPMTACPTGAGLRPGVGRLREHGRLRDLRRAADLRRGDAGRPQPVRLHAADHVPPGLRLRDDVGRLRRDVQLRHLRRQRGLLELPVRRAERDHQLEQRVDVQQRDDDVDDLDDQRDDLDAAGFTSSTSGFATSSSGFTSSSTGEGVGASGTTGSGNGGSGGGGSGSGDSAQNGGCGCRTAGEPTGPSSSSLSAFGALAFAGLLRGRRRARR